MPELEIVRPPGLLDYAEGLALQQDLRADVVAGRSPGTLVLCEHPSVYTAGRRTEPSDLPTDGAPVVEVDRGGRITWHGPGSSWRTRSSASPSHSTSWRGCATSSR
ncbi:hypothetical protein P9139_16630 [Curtobacterium flaccumfaciens]|nr:hypothetical protein P9139_16630 [Curtobacterium flaccumfaciens]